MSIDAMRWAWSLKNVTPTEKLIVLSFADRAGESHEAWPSWKRLEMDTGLNRKTIAKNMASLQHKGILINTGLTKRQVVVYKLNGVKGRDDEEKLSTPSTKNGTSTTTTTSTKNGTPTSTKNGTTTSTKNGIWKPNKKHKEKPNRETPVVLFFSCLKDVQNHIAERAAASGTQLTDDLRDQLLCYLGDDFSDTDTIRKKINMALKKMRFKQWNIPHGYKGITSKSIAEKEQLQQIQKEKEQAQDGILVRELKKAVIHGKSREAVNEMFKHLRA